LHPANKHSKDLSQDLKLQFLKHGTLVIEQHW